MPISVDPAVPTTDSPVTLVFTTFSKCPETIETIDGFELTFEVRDSPNSNGFCLTTATRMELTWEVRVLDAGEYQVTHISPWLDTETESFVVIEGSTPGGPAPIPTTGAVGALVLAVALALAASRILRRGRAVERSS